MPIQIPKGRYWTVMELARKMKVTPQTIRRYVRWRWLKRALRVKIALTKYVFLVPVQDLHHILKR